MSKAIKEVFISHEEYLRLLKTMPIIKAQVNDNTLIANMGQYGESLSQSLEKNIIEAIHDFQKARVFIKLCQPPLSQL